MPFWTHNGMIPTFNEYIMRPDPLILRPEPVIRPLRFEPEPWVANEIGPDTDVNLIGLYLNPKPKKKY